MLKTVFDDMEQEMAYSIDFRRKVIEAHEKEGVLPKQLAADFRIAELTVRRWIRQYKQTGSLEPGKPPGRPGKFDKAVLYQLATDHADATEAELLELLFEHTGVRVHLSAIGYHLRRMGLTFKKRHAKPLNLKEKTSSERPRSLSTKEKG